MIDVVSRKRSFRPSDAQRGAHASPEVSLGLILEGLDGAILVVDQELRIVQANAKASALLGCRSEGSSLAPYVLGEHPAESAEMRRRVKAAISGGRRALIALEHGGRGRLICSVKALPSSHALPPLGLVSLTREDQPAGEVSGYLSEVYKLSRAEAEIAVCASTGAEVSQMIQERQVSIHTLRAQIASIKAKMGLSRMTEIAVAVSRIQAAARI